MTPPRDKATPLPGASAAEALPDSLASIVSTVVRRTRLRRREKAEIAAELEGHFRDGLARGRGVDELARVFGDPRAAARELRRGAIAKRSPLDRFMRRTMRAAGAAAGVLALVYLGLAVHVAGLTPTLSFDPIATYRASLPETATPAWPIYLDALAWARSRSEIGGPDDSFGNAERRDVFDEAIDRFALGEAGFDGVVRETASGDQIEPVDVRAILASRRTELDELRRAASLPALGREPTTDPSLASDRERAYFGTPNPDPPAEEEGSSNMLLSLLLPQLSELRAAARLLEADARLAEENREPSRAAANLAAMFGVARHAEEDRTLIGQLVAAAIRVRACRAIVAMLERGGDRVDEASLRRLADSVGSVPDSALRMDLSIERLMFEDVMQRMYSDDGAGGGMFIPWAFAEFMPMADAMGGSPGGDGFDATRLAGMAFAPLAYLAPDRAETMAQYDRWMDAHEEDGRRPWWDDRRSSEAIEREIMPDVSRGMLAGGNPVLGLLLPALGPAIDTLAVQRFDLDAAAIAIALARFHATNGAWPRSLEELSPGLLPATPIDPETTSTYRYELRAAGPSVWSTGPDGIDDDGRPFRGAGNLVTDAGGVPSLVRIPQSKRRGPTVRTAILKFRDRTGAWPASVDALTAEDLAEVPQSAVEVVAYRLDGERPSLRRTELGDAQLRHPVSRDEVPQGDRVLVQWGLGTFQPQAMPEPVADDSTE